MSVIDNLLIFSCFLNCLTITIVLLYESYYMSHGIKIKHFHENTQKIVFVRENWLLFLYIHIPDVIKNSLMCDSYHMTHATWSYSQENIFQVAKNGFFVIARDCVGVSHILWVHWNAYQNSFLLIYISVWFIILVSL